ncbi:hypothetical protein [Sphingomonas cavernae]|uniref:Uncharacterized protein n=1 Tax=Sphingomonas cavernae TaxID=2320861 RepID=A0A418WJK9_9SPHN|nr:hypothetical protein [Sphingomonas cavernae]RJF90241.1 hypothetical protein D3876_08135 [Sphingomonas cavernae]
MTSAATTGPLWTQDQAIAYEAALEAVNDVIAGYSEQIFAEQNRQVPDQRRVALLRMRSSQARDVSDALDVTDDVSVRQVLTEYSAIVRARDAAEALTAAA